MQVLRCRERIAPQCIFPVSPSPLAAECADLIGKQTDRPVAREESEEFPHSLTVRRPTDGRVRSRSDGGELARRRQRQTATWRAARGPPLALSRMDGRGRRTRSRQREGRRPQRRRGESPPWLNATSTRRNFPATGRNRRFGRRHLHRFVVCDR